MAQYGQWVGREDVGDMVNVARDAHDVQYVLMCTGACVGMFWMISCAHSALVSLTNAELYSGM